MAVKISEVAKLTSVTVRTLHYYDEIYDVFTLYLWKQEALS